MTGEPTFTNILFHQAAVIETVGEEVAALSSAFRRTGNREVAQQLEQFSLRLEEATAQTKAAWQNHLGRSLDEDVKNSFSNLRNMIESA